MNCNFTFDYKTEAFYSFKKIMSDFYDYFFKELVLNKYNITVKFIDDLLCAQLFSELNVREFNCSNVLSRDLYKFEIINTIF